MTGNASVSAGTFTLTYNGQETSPLPYNATVKDVADALEALSSIPWVGAVHVYGDSGPQVPEGTTLDNGGNYEILILTDWDSPEISVDSTGLTGGTYGISTIANGSGNLSPPTVWTPDMVRLRWGTTGSYTDWVSADAGLSTSPAIKAWLETFDEVDPDDVPFDGDHARFVYWFGGWHDLEDLPCGVFKGNT